MQGLLCMGQPHRFTKENARHFQALSVETQRQNNAQKRAQAEAERQTRLNLVPALPTVPADTRRTRLEQQLDKLAVDIAEADSRGKVGLKLKLMQAQLALWRVLYPAPGALKPKAGKALNSPVELPDPELVSNPVSHDPSSSSVSTLESEA